MDIKLKKEKIHEHFEWYAGPEEYYVLYFAEFKRKKAINEELFKKIQDQLILNVKNPDSACHIFIVLPFSGSKVEDYYKLWKQVERTTNINFLFKLQEKKYHEYYVGMAECSPDKLYELFLLQFRYFNSACVLISNEDHSLINIDKVAELFVQKDNLRGFNNLIKDYCDKNTIISRIGDAGEDWEIAFISSGKAFV